MIKTKPYKALCLTFLLLLVVLYTPVSAVPPVTKVQQFSEGYVIKIPQDNVLKVAQDYDFEFHVYNISNGVPIVTNTNCSLHIYNSSGKHIYEGYTTALTHDFDYGFFIDGANFTVAGVYYYNILCFSPQQQKDGALLGGYDASVLYVTPTGITFNSVLNNPILLILGILALVLVLFGALKGIPWLGFIGSVLFILIGLYTMIYGFDNVTDLYTRSVALVLIGMGFIFMISSAYEWLYADGDE